MDYFKKSLQVHAREKGKMEIKSRVPLKTKDDLSIAYTPGVAEPCRAINKNPNDAYKYTIKGNLVAVVTDGSAVLGLGNIGAAAAMPVMEGKCLLFKEFGDVDAFPICLETQDTDEIVQAVKWMEPTFGGINLEDIAAPRCFEIEERLKKELKIPVFHDDQHGTAVVALGALINALKVTGRKIGEQQFVMLGAGAAGIAVSKIFMRYGAKNLLLLDQRGILWEGREGMNPAKIEMARLTNPKKRKGGLEDAMKGADVFVGMAVAGLVSEEMVRSMNPDPIIFAMANPTPEIMPDKAKKGGARIVATGRSDFPNQINNVLAFPGIFRGALDARAPKITEKMKVAAAEALASLVKKPTEERILPYALEKGVGEVVAKAVRRAAG